MGSDDLSLTSDGYFSIRLEELLLHKKVKLLRQMNDLYQWCGQILEAKFLSLSLLTFGEPVSFSFLEDGERLYTSEQRCFCFAGVTKFKKSHMKYGFIFSINDELIQVQEIAYFHLDWRFKLFLKKSIITIFSWWLENFLWACSPGQVQVDQLYVGN